MPRRFLPNLLATRTGRLVAFFLLYVTEGIPLGFTATAIATQMRREGLGPAQIGAFVGTLYLPWAWKWAIGPVVDLVWSDRLGRRRGWIIGAQVLMVATLMLGMGIDYTSELALFTGLILVVNTFGATQDVAIDALAVASLHEDERGFANGLMFGGAYLGQAVGGSGVLFLATIMPFATTWIFVGGCVLLVTLFVALPMREPKVPREPVEGPRLRAVSREVGTYLVTALKSFFGTRSALAAAIFGLLPCGAYSLSLALQSNLAVELGMSDASIGALALWSTLIAAGGCIAGGVLSDRIGRRRSLALYVVATAIPTLLLAYTMTQHGRIMPIDPNDPGRPETPADLLRIFWIACIAYSLFVGLMYGTRTALFMDVCNPAVAATQFTAYMSLLNVAIWYSATWQGWAIERFGYPKTLAADAAIGMICLAPLVFARKIHHAIPEIDDEGVPIAPPST